MVLNEQEHKGGIKSYTHDVALVAEPVEVTIDGKATKLTLMDARLLIDGLSEAVYRVEKAEAAVQGGNERCHLMVIGNTRSGMSIQPASKLGVGSAIEQLMMAFPPEERTPEMLRALTPPHK